jgi:tRNA A-37 threonylcarbamoyl transferase component Bud32
MKRIRLKGVEWWCTEDFAPLLRELPWHRLRRPRELPPDCVAKDNFHRTVARLNHPRHPSRPGFYVKRHKFARRDKQFKHLLAPWRLRREWTMGRRLRAEGLPTPEPLAYGERWRGPLPREAFYITREIPDVVSLKQRLTQAPPGADNPALQRAARLTAALANHGLYHLDYHAENILLRAESSDRTPFIMDLHDMRRGRVTERRMRRMLAMLANSLELHGPGSGRLQAFIRTLLGHRSGGSKADRERVRRWGQRVARQARRLRRRRLRSRTRRCIVESTTYTSDTTDEFRIHRRRDFPVKTAREVVEKHRRALRGAYSSVEVLKNSSRGGVTLVPCDSVPRVEAHRPCPPEERTPDTVCVKSFNAPTFLKRLKDRLRPRSRALKAWIALHGFSVRELPAPLPIAVLERRSKLTSGNDYLVMEGKPNAANLLDVVHGGVGAATRRELARQVADALVRLDDAETYHPDLKPGNFLVWHEDGRLRVCLVDMSRVKFESPGGRRRWVRWLNQLNRQMPPSVTTLDRLRCLRACNTGEWSRREETEIAREVMEKTRAETSG